MLMTFCEWPRSVRTSLPLAGSQSRITPLPAHVVHGFPAGDIRGRRPASARPGCTAGRRSSRCRGGASSPGSGRDVPDLDLPVLAAGGQAPAPGLVIQARTPRACSGRGASAPRPLAASQMRTVPSLLAVAKVRPSAPKRMQVTVLDCGRRAANGRARAGRDGTAVSGIAIPSRAASEGSLRAGDRRGRCYWPTIRARPGPCGGSRGSSRPVPSGGPACRASSVARTSRSSRR